jgi:hypothetical protein
MSQHKTNPNALQAKSARPTCASCVHMFRQSTTGGECRRNPPTGFLSPQPQKTIAGMQMQLAPMSAWPPVQNQHYCAEHPDFMRWWSANREAFDALTQATMAIDVSADPAETKVN